MFVVAAKLAHISDHQQANRCFLGKFLPTSHNVAVVAVGHLGQGMALGVVEANVLVGKHIQDNLLAVHGRRCREVAIVAVHADGCPQQVAEVLLREGLAAVGTGRFALAISLHHAERLALHVGFWQLGRLGITNCAHQQHGCKKKVFHHCRLLLDVLNSAANINNKNQKSLLV